MQVTDCRKAARRESLLGERLIITRLTEGWPEGRIETFGEGRDRLPQGSSEGGAGREILRIN
jgi:hypothetical protein